MKRINVLISEESRLILDDFQRKNKISTIDDAVDMFIKSCQEKL